MGREVGRKGRTRRGNAGCWLQDTATSGLREPRGGGAARAWHSEDGPEGPGAQQEGAPQLTRAPCPPADGVAWPLLPLLQPPPPPPLAGIIDLSQVPHLPVLVPPTPGTPATAMDRLAYLPTAPQHFSSRLSSSPLSPGNTPAPVLGLGSWRPRKVAGCPLSTPEDQSRPSLSAGLNRGTFGCQGVPLT